jgi:Spy/CpxP family protein refolding chaperone
MLKPAVFVALLLLIGANAHAFGGPCVMGRGYGLDPSVAEDLRLTEDQKAVINSLHESFEHEYLPLQNLLFGRRGELERLWAEADPDQTRIKAKQREIREVQSRIQEMATQYHLKCRQVLTPEQRNKLAAFREYYRGSRVGHTLISE